MFKKLTLAAAAASTALVALPAAAEAHPGYYGRGYDNGYYNNGYDDSGYYNNGYYNNGYASGGYYGGHRYRPGDYYGRGYSNRYYGRNRHYYRGDRCSGTTGAIVGAVAGGLLGREVTRGDYGRGDETAGLIVGGALGALAGRSIGRHSC